MQRSLKFHWPSSPSSPPKPPASCITPVKCVVPKPGQRNVKEQVAINVDLLRAGIGGERILVPEDEIGIFADVDGASAIVNADDPRGVQRDHADGFVFGGAAVVDHLAGFLIEAANVVVGVALERDLYAFTHAT